MAVGGAFRPLLRCLIDAWFSSQAGLSDESFNLFEKRELSWIQLLLLLLLSLLHWLSG